MRLTKIKLAGFKSFVDPTTIHVPSNLVGVVGPNGCGKSNIIDAVRWVMGETSAKNLRGDSMADVIFNGSRARKPVGHASIELVFDNTEGKIGGQYAGYSEISIRRQVSRDGTSNYFLNNTRCRRRDITDVFLGTGLGPRSYSIIEQGMISRLIEAKPDDLRAFLEEAAGISKYKERRRETENRIRHTRENLDRLNDLLEEIDKQLEKLKRQSRAAERYRELKAEERQVRGELLSLRYRDMQQEYSGREKEMKERQLAMDEALAEQRRIESELEKLRDSLTGANEEFNQVQGAFYRLGAEVARVEQAIQHNKESRQQQQEELSRAEQALGEVDEHIRIDSGRLEELAASIAEIEPELETARSRSEQSGANLQEAEQAMKAWQQEWDAFNQQAAERSQVAQVERTRLDHLERHVQQLDGRLQRISEEQQALDGEGVESGIEQLAINAETQQRTVADMRARLDDAARRIADARGELEQKQQELAALQSVHHDTRGHLVSLETLQKAALGSGGGHVGEWLKSSGLQSAPRLAQEMQVEPGWEHAVETALGFYLEAVCVEGFDETETVLSGLKEGDIALLDTSAMEQGATAAGRGVALSSKITSRWPTEGLLSGVFAVENLSEAFALRSSLAPGESVITRDGVWLGNGWLRVARDTDESAGVLEREREIAELTRQVAAQAASIEELKASISAARERLREGENEREGLQSGFNEAHRHAGELQARLVSEKSRLEEKRTLSENASRESNELQTQIETETREKQEAQSRLDEALAAIDQLSEEREQRTRRQQELSALLDDARERSRSDQHATHELALRAESMRTAHESTGQALNRMREQLRQLSGRRDELTSLLGQDNRPLAELEEQLGTLLTGRSEVESELGAARGRVENIEHGIRELDRQRLSKEQSVTDLREQAEQVRMAWQEIRVRSDTLMEQINEQGYDYPALLEELDEEATVQAWAEHAEKLEMRIQRLGPINLAAIDEYEEESKRKVHLDAQHADLTEALETLENAIGKIDRETRSRFRETFEQVNAGMQENFPLLFGGGHAYLELTGEDLLDTGVTVMARPPGKRNSTIHLLSGGEKALTAIALVFAIFKLNPSPFCMLDEVDAPLDDANVGRYCDMVRKMSEQVQFIFITHNKITMEMANQLTGVTMHEPGCSRLVAVDVDEAVEMVAV